MTVETRDAESFLNTFPNCVDGPQEEHSILHGEAVRFRCLLRAIAKRTSAIRRSGHATPRDIREAAYRAIHEYYRPTYRLDPAAFERDRDMFIASVKDARASVQSLIAEYFPMAIRLSLEMSSDVDSQDDPFELLRLCGLRGDDQLTRRTRFEARRQLTLAQLYFEMRRHGDSPDELDRDMSEFDDILKDAYFMRRRSAGFSVIADLDPEDQFRVRTVTSAPHASSEARRISTETQVALYPDVRYVCTPNGREIPVYYETRVKRDAPFKLFMKNDRYVGALKDLVGAKFVFFSEEDLIEGVDALRRSVVRIPGTVFGEASNIKRAGVLDRSNGHSAAEFRATKYNVILLDRIFELQFMLVKDWLNERCSRGPENHVLYKRKSLHAKLFHKLFPSTLYFDWDDAELAKTLTNLQLAKIWSAAA